MDTTQETTSNAKRSIDQVVNYAFSVAGDITLRDGLQSWDRNRWAIKEDVLPVAAAIDALHKKGKSRGIKMPSVEVAGGGQALQPAKFMGEDTLENVSDIKKVMPNTDLQCLNRGRQCFGFDPVSYEVQESAIEAYGKRGVKVFRIFDMMNDPENLKDGFKALNAYKEKHGKDSAIIEGAISYMSPPDDKMGPNDKGRAMTHKEYAEFAVELAKMGADQITIKNYAGVGDKEMPSLIKTIHAELTKAGYKDMAINLHDHGQKPEVLADALAAGASKVDVAIGELSGGPSHTNMRSLITTLLQREGYDLKDADTKRAVDAHPMMKELTKVEKAVAEVVNRERGTAEAPHSFKSDRAMLEKITQADVDRYHIASGAFSDPVDRIEARYKDGKPKGFPEKEVYFRRVLEKGRDLWQEGGQFNTVTPGAMIVLNTARELVDLEIYQKIAVDSYKAEHAAEYENRVTKKALELARDGGQKFVVNPDGETKTRAMQMVNEEISPSRIPMEKYNKIAGAFIDIQAGRYGRNRGMEKADEFAKLHGKKAAMELGLGDIAGRDARLIFRALKRVNEGLESGKISEKDLGLLSTTAQLGSQETGRLLVTSKNGKKEIDLKDPSLEDKLRASDIQDFRDAIRLASFDEGLKTKIAGELRIGRFATPTEGLDLARAKIAELAMQGIDIQAMHESGHRISSAEDAAILAMTLREKANGFANFEKVARTALAMGPVAETATSVDGVPGHLAVAQASREAQAARAEGRLN